ncbi:5574_t:CDS:2 [Gigaspora rosea]|nr:5574_t:CDS:2 [Gigaspora rosea]
MALSNDNEIIQLNRHEIMHSSEAQLITQPSDNNEAQLITQSSDNDEAQLITQFSDNDKAQLITQFSDNNKAQLITQFSDNDKAQLITQFSDNDETQPSNSKIIQFNNSIQLDNDTEILDLEELTTISTNEQILAPPYVGQIFDSWELADQYFNNYDWQENFVIIRTRNDQDPLPEQICTYVPKKSVILENQRNSKLKRSGYPWHVNVTFPKKAVIVSITLLNISHNHLLDPITNSYATKNRTLPEAVLREIYFYTTEGNLNTTIQRKLLSAKFPNITIFPYLRLCDEARYINHNEWYYANSSAQLSGASAEWEMLSQQRHEIIQSLYDYTVIESNELPAYEPSKEEYNMQQIHLKSLLADLSSNEITKIRGDDVFSSEVCCAVQKRHDYGETFNLAQKIVQSAVETGGESLCRLKKSLNDWLAKKQKLTKVNDNDKENFDPSQVEDPIEQQHRERPLVKRLKSSFEQPKSKKPTTQNKCDKCGVAGHYAPTCKN